MKVGEAQEIVYLKDNLCFILAAIIKKNIKDLLKFCRETNISLPREETRQWKRLIDIANQLEQYKWNMDYDSVKAFNYSANQADVFLRCIISKIETLEEFKAWQFYNYIKMFPVRCNAITPTIDEERQAFSKILNEQ